MGECLQLAKCHSKTHPSNAKYMGHSLKTRRTWRPGTQKGKTCTCTAISIYLQTCWTDLIAIKLIYWVSLGINDCVIQVNLGLLRPSCWINACLWRKVKSYKPSSLIYQLFGSFSIYGRMKASAKTFSKPMENVNFGITESSSPQQAVVKVVIRPCWGKSLKDGQTFDSEAFTFQHCKTPNMEQVDARFGGGVWAKLQLNFSISQLSFTWRPIVAGARKPNP